MACAAVPKLSRKRLIQRRGLLQDTCTCCAAAPIGAAPSSWRPRMPYHLSWYGNAATFATATQAVLTLWRRSSCPVCLYQLLPHLMQLLILRDTQQHNGGTHNLLGLCQIYHQLLLVLAARHSRVHRYDNIMRTITPLSLRC
jgi:hypothetical protein